MAKQVAKVAARKNGKVAPVKVAARKAAKAAPKGKAAKAAPKGKAAKAAPVQREPLNVEALNAEAIRSFNRTRLLSVEARLKGVKPSELVKASTRAEGRNRVMALLNRKAARKAAPKGTARKAAPAHKR